MKRPELLAPAGDLEKLKIACLYGADAVYFGGTAFSLRAGAGNLTLEEMEEGISFAHARGVKCYLTVNIYPHHEDLAPLREYIESLRGLPLDGILVSDPGTLVLLREILPEVPLHLSTQANLTNALTAKFWYDQGVSRVVCARELSLSEIRHLKEGIPPDMEVEAFVHGAMCISYSGRCLLSNYMTGRDANRGACAHPCRWQYRLVEEQRPGEYYPVEEDERGTYILNSKDLCMIRHLKELAEAGVTSFKIEGRMKSIYYLAVVVSCYRRAIDDMMAGKPFDETLLAELDKASHRAFSTGFYFGKPGEEGQNYGTSAYIRNYTFLGLVLKEEGEWSLVEQRNKMVKGETIEVLLPSGESFEQTLDGLLDEERTPIDSAPHAQQKVYISFPRPVPRGALLRKRKET